MTDSEAMQVLIQEWFKMRDWAASLLVDHLELNSPIEILESQHRGRKPIAETGWSYRTHGFGVDVVHNHGRGGIDFDFDIYAADRFAAPDSWRLLIFAERALQTGTLPAEIFRGLVSDEDRFERVADSELRRMGLR